MVDVFFNAHKGTRDDDPFFIRASSIMEVGTNYIVTSLSKANHSTKTVYPSTNCMKDILEYVKDNEYRSKERLECQDL